MDAMLLLEDGTLFRGRSFTGPGEAFGELVFNTSLTGYQEVISDPSYAGQIVLLTAPMIGNYGIRRGEEESARVWAEGLVVREYGGRLLSESATGEPPAGPPAFARPSYDPQTARGDALAQNSPVTGSLADCLAASRVPGVEGVDTRALTRRIRDKGAMRCGLSTRTSDPRAFLAKVRASPSMLGRSLVRQVSTSEPYLYAQGPGPRIAVLDCGVKASSLRELARRGCRVEVFPAYTGTRELLRARPQGLLVSNGPGDPATLPEIVAVVAEALERLPVFGICLGHQLLAQALGARTFKLPFGHHGSNHPVREEASGRVFITAQNHGFAVDPEGLARGGAEATLLNLNDRTNEGLRHRRLAALGVQFHPEAAPGPHDTLFLFDAFLKMAGEARARA
jgi:carbamoyl-phosphate synthase small subunit